LTIYDETRGELKSLSELIERRSGDVVQWHGSGTGKRLLHTVKVAVADVSLAKEAKMEPHQHEATEVVAVYEGSLEMLIGGEPVTVNEKEAIIIPANTPHELVVASGSVQAICLTMPADEGYP